MSTFKRRNIFTQQINVDALVGWVLLRATQPINGARYVDGDRFISQDPISFAGGDTNLYRYVGNSPT